MEPTTFTKYEPVTRYSKWHPLEHFAGENRQIYGRERPYAFRRYKSSKVKPSYYGSNR